MQYGVEGGVFYDKYSRDCGGLLVMPKYWGKQIFTHFPEVGQKQKTEKKERKRERPKVGNNNCQLRIATPPRVAHAKPPGPIHCLIFCLAWNGHMFSVI